MRPSAFYGLTAEQIGAKLDAMIDRDVARICRAMDRYQAQCDAQEAKAKAEREAASLAGAAKLRAPDGPKVHRAATIEEILGIGFIRS